MLVEKDWMILQIPRVSWGETGAEVSMNVLTEPQSERAQHEAQGVYAQREEL